jgi:flagellar motor switch protein FliM
MGEMLSQEEINALLRGLDDDEEGGYYNTNRISCTLG